MAIASTISTIPSAINEYFSLPLGINDISKKQLLIYPNPTTDHITIILPDQSPFTEVIITNAFGQEISRGRYSNTNNLKLDIDGASGLFFVRVVAGGMSGVYKIVKM